MSVGVISILLAGVRVVYSPSLDYQELYGRNHRYPRVCRSLVLDKTEGITILTIPSSVKEKKEVSKQIVAPSDTYLARCEHALNGDADSHDAQGGGPVIAKNRSAYLESMSSARERSYAKRARRLHDRSCRRAIINGRHDEF